MDVTNFVFHRTWSCISAFCAVRWVIPHDVNLINITPLPISPVTTSHRVDVCVLRTQTNMVSKRVACSAYKTFPHSPHKRVGTFNAIHPFLFIHFRPSLISKSLIYPRNKIGYHTDYIQILRRVHQNLIYFSVPKHTIFTKSEVLTAADGDSDFLGCYATSTGKWVQIFPMIIVPSTNDSWTVWLWRDRK